MQAVLLEEAYQAESASDLERKRHTALFCSSVVAFRLRTKRLDVKPHTGGFSLKTVFSGCEHYEFTDNRSSVNSGEVLFVRQNVYRSSISTPNETDSFSLFFPQLYYNELIRPNDVLQRFMDSTASSVSLSVGHGFLNLLMNLARELEAPSTKPAFEELLCQLKDAIEGYAAHSTATYDRIGLKAAARGADRLRRMIRVREMLHDNVAREIALAELAAEACMSEYHLLRCFREAFGLKPGRYLEELRMRKADELLANSNLPVKVVAQVAGYTHFSAFAARSAALGKRHPECSE